MRTVNDYRLVLNEVLGRRRRAANLCPVFLNLDTSSAPWLGLTRTS